MKTGELVLIGLLLLFALPALGGLLGGGGAPLFVGGGGLLTSGGAVGATQPPPGKITWTSNPALTTGLTPRGTGEGYIFTDITGRAGSPSAVPVPLTLKISPSGMSLQ